MSRLDEGRRLRLEPGRMSETRRQLIANGCDIRHGKVGGSLEVTFADGRRVIFWPYSGWFSGKGGLQGRGFKKLLQEVKDAKARDGARAPVRQSKARSSDRDPRHGSRQGPSRRPAARDGTDAVRHEAPEETAEAMSMSPRDIVEKLTKALEDLVEEDTRILCNSYGLPGNHDATWRAEYANADPDGYALIVQAEEAVAAGKEWSQ